MTNIPAPVPPQATPYNQAYSQPYASAYSSPIPIQRTHLGHALASEWTKIRTVRSTMWTLGLMLLLVIGLGLLMTVTVGREEYDSSPILSFALPGALLGQLPVVALGVLVITSEYGTGMIRTTLTACPQRARVLAAKAIVFFTLSFVLTTAATALTALVNYVSFNHRAPHGGYDYEYLHILPSASAGEFVRVTLGCGLYMAVIGLLSLAVGALLRHTAGAITTMLGVLLLPLLVAIFMPSDNVRETLIKYSAPNLVAALHGIPMIDDTGNGWGLLGLLSLITAAVLALAFAVHNERDV